MRTYDAATYSDLKQGATLYMIQPAILTEDVMNGNTSSFQIVLDGVRYPARVDMEDKVHVMMNGSGSGSGSDQIVYKAMMSGGRKHNHTRKRNRNRNRNRIRNRTRNFWNHNRNSSDGY